MQLTFIFDLGGVYFTDGTKNAIEKISSLYAIDKKLVFEVFREKIGTAYRKGNITFNEFCEKAKEHWQYFDISPDTILEIWLSGYQPICGTKEIIKKLRDMGYKVFYLSGNAPDRTEYLNRKYHFLSNFDGGLFTCDVGISKTELTLYETILTRFNCSPDNCIMIDDKLEYLSIAAQSGMKTIHFTMPETLKKEIVKLKLFH